MGATKQLLETDFKMIDWDYEYAQYMESLKHKEKSCKTCIHSQPKKSKKPCWKCINFSNYDEI